MSMWHVYMLRCSDGSLYTGATTDVARRFAEHKAGKIGAKYTRAKIVLHVAYKEACASRSIAQKREHALKKLPKAEKEALAKQYKAEERALSRKKR